MKFTGDKVSLSSDSVGRGWSDTLVMKLSYCAKASDCGGQGLIVAACVGSFTCGSGIGSPSANTCGWNCGVLPEPDEIWPASATRVVAENSGGGFRRPPPAGSTCALGRAKYTLDRASRRLDWETCDSSDNLVPRTW